MSRSSACGQRRASAARAEQAYSSLAFFDSPADLRRLIESLNFQLRKVTKAKGHFPNDEATTNLRYLLYETLKVDGPWCPRV